MVLRRLRAFRPVVGLSVAVLFLASACRSLESPQYRRVENLRVAQWDFNHPLVKADVVYYNPNGVGFEFRGAKVDLYLDSLWLGHTELDTSIHIAPHSEFVITLPIQLDLQRLLRSGLQTYLNRQVNVKVDGIVSGSKAGIVRTFPVHYEGMQQLNLKLF